MIDVLFLCTGNSARSVMAEVILNDLGAGRFHAQSAGSAPAGKVNPGAERELIRRGHGAEGLESKSWDRFAGDDATAFDVVITVCDNAAGESCPVWRGSPVTAHWGIPDPAAVNGDEAAVDAAFALAYDRLRRRIQAWLRMPETAISAERLRTALQAIASIDSDTDVNPLRQS